MSQNEFLDQLDSEQQLHDTLHEQQVLQPDQSRSDDVNSALQQASSKRQKTGGARMGLLWDSFIKSAEKKNTSHYWASCRFCCAAGR